MSDEYTATPTVVRIYEENGEWFIDGLDPRTDKYTDAVWSYDTREDALLNVGSFIRYAKHYLFTWEWPTDHKFRVGDSVFLTEDAVTATVRGITDEGLFLVEVEGTHEYTTISEEFLTSHRTDNNETAQPEDGRAPWEDSYQAYGHM